MSTALCQSVAQRDSEDFGTLHVLDCAFKTILSSPVSSPRPISTSAGPGAARAKSTVLPQRNRGRACHSPTLARRRDYRALSKQHPNQRAGGCGDPFVASCQAARFTTKRGLREKLRAAHSGSTRQTLARCAPLGKTNAASPPRCYTEMSFEAAPHRRTRAECLGAVAYLGYVDASGADDTLAPI